MRACKCPECGAEIEIDDINRDFGFCQYCGAKIMLDDYRSTQRYVDEARVKEAEVRMKELEIEGRENQARRNGIKLAFTIAAVLAVVGVILCVADNYVGLFLIYVAIHIALITVCFCAKDKNDMPVTQRSNMAKFSSEAYGYSNKSYSVVEEAIVSCGFTNIKLLNMHDLTTGLLKKPGTVETVTIDGETPIWNKWYDKSARIVISYHGFQSDS